MALGSLIPAAATLARLYFEAYFAPPNTLTGFSLEERSPEVIEKLLPFYGWLYQYYFRVTTDGWQHIPQEGQVLLIGSHNGGLAAPDMLMVVYDWFRRFGTQRLAYALTDSRAWQFLPGLARLATQVGAIQSRPQMAIAALQRGASLLIYPGGVQDVFRPHSLRNTIYFCGHRGFVKLALQERIPIVPIVSRGAHSTLFVLADIYPQLQQLHQLGLPWLFGIDPGTFPLYLGLPWGIAAGPLPNIPLPMQLHTRVCPPIVFERYGEEAARDRNYVDECYDLVCRLMQEELDRLVQ
jgi:1-acyl-sn-glycerol-3-phosphate acyltransferase